MRRMVAAVPPVVVEARAVVERFNVGMLWALLSTAPLGLWVGSLGWMDPTSHGSGFVAALVLVVVGVYQSQRKSPSNAERMDAMAVMNQWEGQRKEWAKRVVDASILELEEADPAFVAAWASGDVQSVMRKAPPKVTTPTSRL